MAMLSPSTTNSTQTAVSQQHLFRKSPVPVLSYQPLPSLPARSSPRWGTKINALRNTHRYLHSIGWLRQLFRKPSRGADGKPASA